MNMHASPTLPFYQQTGRECALFETAQAGGLPLLLKGPTGCGKTRFVEHMAARLGKPLYTVACHDDLSAADLIGRYLLKGGETVWVDGPLTRAVREGGICYLDEVVEARKDVTVVLHPLTDTRRTLMIDRTGEELTAPAGFMLVASYNPGYQNVLKRLKPSTRQRFLSIGFDFPDAETEIAVVASESGLDKSRVAPLVRLAGRIRGLVRHGPRGRRLHPAGDLRRDADRGRHGHRPGAGGGGDRAADRRAGRATGAARPDRHDLRVIAMRLSELMDPEEAVGNIWHDMASGIGAEISHPEAGVALASVRPSLALLFRALGGGAGVELNEAPATVTRHRQPLRRKIGAERDREFVARFDGERLSLPPFLAAFPEAGLNRAAYFWLTALAAVSDPEARDVPEAGPARDCAQIRANAAAADRALALCPGLREAHARMAQLCAAGRAELMRPRSEAAMEQAVRDQLGGTAAGLESVTASRGHMPFAPVPIWLEFGRPGAGHPASEEDADDAPPPPGAATTTRKLGERRDNEQTRRSDSFIMHRFESILSWVESMNINRSVHDDDDENAQKAAEDQDRITLSKHDRKTATRLRLHLDLSPSDADHEALAGVHTYPEWNHRTRSYMEGHCRVLDAPAQPDPCSEFRPDPRRVRQVRRQFEALRPRRVLQPRQVEGSELDLDALLTTRADLEATGRGSDRIWQAARQTERDLSVAFLVDMSRSTEAAIGETSVIDVMREAVAGLAAGIDAAGDRLGIWGFSSLRRDRVFLTRIKGFEAPMSPGSTPTSPPCAPAITRASAPRSGTPARNWPGNPRRGSCSS